MSACSQVAWELSRCHTEGCEEEGTEPFGDLYLCLSCYVTRMTRVTDSAGLPGTVTGGTGSPPTARN